MKLRILNLGQYVEVGGQLRSVSRTQVQMTILWILTPCNIISAFQRV